PATIASCLSVSSLHDSPPFFLSLSILAPPRRSTLFPYTTLFRSKIGRSHQQTTQVQHRITLATACRTEISSTLTITLGLTVRQRWEEHTSEVQSRENLVCRLLLEKKKKKSTRLNTSTMKNSDADY